MNDGKREEREEERWRRPLSEREKSDIREEHKSWLIYIALLALGGITLGVVIAAFVIHLDINGIGSMLARSSNRVGFTLILAGGMASTFAMVVMGAGIMIRSSLGR